ncbi:conserved hypothetical protein [Dinoroseobacter shibae DFL 12 = DSM 16493]|jgi:hypothetical protein|uniref:Uncharacterized protein n=1 Tax=Dinoroseobacter shibae (strain DSM 16493 / NCIMB 14021 / DFL 12) TaxID=398580 RepID=A8LJK5_DINSH|nr:MULTISPECIES: hypothetical protein [Dinoroseobacter]ABV94608.1 conserved hypothetical protein [Dinoroseobacter shibae DFL 12 = DSM 16493]MDD9716949.1 hypothetical protein [Dinoroseobacter sp. PD6]URF46035.1 hypothetical protein M8008_14815 [Dinoroseobacter shibae]URF50341.1 hypothetical protein M8007_14815 [Dinoroseobacter shibae]
MKTQLKTLCFGLLSTLLLTGAALGQTRALPCAEREKVVQRLTTNYGETVQSMGLGANNGVMEVFASEETGTWTITVTMPNGQTCLIASGQAFEGSDVMDRIAAGDDV